MVDKNKEIAKKIGSQVQAMRVNRNLSLTQVATEAHLTRTTLAEIEKGTANPSIETLIRICDALEIDLPELFQSKHYDYGEENQIILQPVNGSLFAPLNGAMESGEYTSCQMLVAYAKSSGVDLITQSIRSMREKGGTVKAYIGIDQKNTTAEALYKLLNICDELYVVHDRAVAQTYHPKVYLLEGPQYIWIAVGSNNLTRGGLYTNYEACTIQKLNQAASQNVVLYANIQEAIRQYCNASLTKEIHSSEDIYQLLDAGLISTEQESRMGIRRSSLSNSPAFGHRSVPDLPNPSYQVPVPVGMFITPDRGGAALQRPAEPLVWLPEPGGSITTTQAVLTAERGPDIDATYWFCAGKLTGGSRNILDLSEGAVLRAGSHPGMEKNGSVPGGVSLFGLDPKNHRAHKDLTILYNDMPYRFSTIKYAPGNSNWRFQLKGKAETGKASLSQFGGDFVNHILLFHRVSEDCYILEVMEEEELSALKEHSSFWATNGKMRNGRPFGVLAF